MQSNIVAGQIRLVVVFICFALFALIILQLIAKNRAVNDLIPLLQDVSVSYEQEKTSGVPSRLKIPAINIDAAVELVGLTKSGAMGAPKGGKNVGWFSSGPHPGDNGSAVIDGHFGRWKNGEGSVFDDLVKLKEGDRLYVENDEGMTTTFVVRELRIYDQNADTRSVFSSNDDKPHLNLITCEGIWNKDSKSYSERLVVFTDKE